MLIDTPDAGARSGVICGIKPIDQWAERIYGCDSDGDCFYVEDLIVADCLDHNQVSQGGDSGGPVFVPRPDLQTVIAKGTIVGRSKAWPYRLYFQDYGTAFRDFRIVPIT